MNFWQIVMLMAWVAMFAVYVWAIIAVLIDVVRREDVSGPATVGWILALVLVPVLGILLYVGLRPKLSRIESQDVAHYESVVSTPADQAATLARLRDEGSLTEDEYRALKVGIIG